MNIQKTCELPPPFVEFTAPGAKETRAWIAKPRSGEASKLAPGETEKPPQKKRTKEGQFKKKRKTVKETIVFYVTQASHLPLLDPTDEANHKANIRVEVETPNHLVHLKN